MHSITVRTELTDLGVAIGKTRPRQARALVQRPKPAAEIIRAPTSSLRIGNQPLAVQGRNVFAKGIAQCGENRDRAFSGLEAALEVGVLVPVIPH